MGQPEKSVDLAELGSTGVVDVLVVDDDEATRSSCADILRHHGMSVVEAEDGMSALRRLASAKVGVIVLDVQMPGLSGPELLDLLDDPPPVVLVTGHFFDEAVLSRGGKITWFLKKPVSPEELVMIVGRCLRRMR